MRRVHDPRFCLFCSNDPEQCHSDMDCEEPRLNGGLRCEEHNLQSYYVEEQDPPGGLLTERNGGY
jgi:hypothetical protein